MFEKIVEIGILFDFYGKLLSKKQYLCIEQYYIHDLSLAEIGENINISRQGVYDNIKRAEEKLYGYEEKLRLIYRFKNNNKNINEILKIVDEIISYNDNDYIDCVKKAKIIKRLAEGILDNNQEVK